MFNKNSIFNVTSKNYDPRFTLVQTTNEIPIRGACKLTREKSQTLARHFLVNKRDRVKRHETSSRAVSRRFKDILQSHSSQELGRSKENLLTTGSLPRGGISGDFWW